jgi:hypothetical protein
MKLAVKTFPKSGHHRLTTSHATEAAACDVLCTMCRVLFDDGDGLHGSTLLYIILDVVVLLL